MRRAEQALLEEQDLPEQLALQVTRVRQVAQGPRVQRAYAESLVIQVRQAEQALPEEQVPPEQPVLRVIQVRREQRALQEEDRKSTRLNSSH